MTITLGAVHHFALTVTDTERSKAFYTSLLGLNHLMDLGPKVLLGNDNIVMALNPPPDPAQAIPDDAFTESRVGLDHISFLVPSLADLEAAVERFDAAGVSHGTINDLSEHGLPIYVLSFRDPDNIQLELTAPKG
jgi:catechol 2,3-dioxygenase-like lactoylglutathione lyase family enzyme